MPRFRRSSSGITLIELLVVLAILGVAISLAGPSMLRSIDRFVLNSAGRRLINTFRTAQVDARLGQRELLGTLIDGEFVFVRGEGRVASLKLPKEMTVESPSGLAVAYSFLPSGQILGPQRLDLVLRDRYRGSLLLGPGPGSVRFEEER